MAERSGGLRIRKATLIEGFLVALVLVSFLNLYLLYTMSSPRGPSGGAPAAQKPVELKLTTISSSSCADCFDPAPVISVIKESGVSVQSEKTLDFSSPEAKKLVSKYGIVRLPAVIVTGDIDKAPSLSQIGEKVDDAYVFTESPPPYVNASTGAIIGRVSLTLISDASCAECFNLSSLQQQLESAGVRVSGTNELDYGASGARALVSRYNITKVPAAIVSEGLSAYPDITAAWVRLGTKEPDGAYVLREIPPPYRLVESGDVKGFVSIIFLNDSACTSCYDVSLQGQILRTLGLHFTSNATYDLNSTEGRDLVSRYNITAAPTVVLSPDASLYQYFSRIWVQVGSVEPDGWLVFRNMAAIRNATYRNLTTGELQTVPLPQSASQPQ